jgi:hypothetical protein
MPEIPQTSMAAGEVTPAMYGRVDLARYFIGLRTCLNWMVRQTGGVTNRPGFRYVGSTKLVGTMARLIDFKVSSTEAYVIELGEYYMRFYYRGGLVRYDLDALTTWTLPSSWVVGDIVKDNGFIYRCILDHTNTDLSFYFPDDPTYWLEIEDIAEVITPWPAADLRGLDYTQSADVMTFCHPDHKQRQLGRYSHSDWRLSVFGNVGGPFGDLNLNTLNTIVATNMTGVVTLTSPENIFTADMVDRYIQIEQNPEALTPRWEVAKAILANAIYKTNSGYYKAIAAGTTGTVRPDHLEGIGYDGSPGVAWQYLHNGVGIALITAYVSPTEVTATVQDYIPESVVNASIPRTITDMEPGAPEVTAPDPAPAENVLVTVLSHGYLDGSNVTLSGVTGITGANGTWAISVKSSDTFELIGCIAEGTWGGAGVVTRTLVASPTYKWSLEEWGGTRGFPATSTYYQQRQIFGGAPGRPQAVQMSKTAGFLDFGKNIPMLDDDAIDFSLNAGTIGHILHFVNLKNLIALTTEGPWMIIKEQGNPIPITDPQGEGGSATVRPLKINKQALYVEDKGGAIRSLGYEFSSDTYEGKDLTVTADHLFEGHSIVEWCFQKIPNHVVWMVRDDGVLIGLTYLVEQEVVAWHRHTTDGLFESISCVTEPTEDAVYAVVRRNVNGSDVRYVEKLNTRIFPTPEDEFIVDSGLTYDGRNAGAGIGFMLSTLTGGWTYQDTLNIETNTAVFTGASDVGDAVVLTDDEGDLLRLTIIEYVSPTQVNVLANRTVPVECQTGTGFDLARDTFTNLGHLEGKTVSILADAKVAPSAVVTAGVVTIPNAAVVVHIGLPIVADIETLEINTPGTTFQGKPKNVNSVSLMVQNTRGLLVGPTPEDLLETRVEISSKFDALYQHTTGILPVNIISDWSKGGRVLIRQQEPLAATILAIIPNVTMPS